MFAMLSTTTVTHKAANPTTAITCPYCGRLLRADCFEEVFEEVQPIYEAIFAGMRENLKRLEEYCEMVKKEERQCL